MFQKLRFLWFMDLFLCIIIGAFLSGISCRVSEKDYRADWPMWRYDANHSAASSVELLAQLHLQWERELHPPRPAFPYEPPMLFDASYEPVVMGNTIFVPSMVSDKVTAYDTATGVEKWKFFVDAPVRFAPVAWRGKLYFVSDDGYLYCLNAAKGKLLWKFRGQQSGLKGRKLLGNQRLISRWPARGGPVLVNGTIYFAAGIWPLEGVYLYALDAETGKVVWSNKDIGFIKDGLLDHDARRDGGLCPQGYLTIIGEKLIVPSGEALPGFFDPKTGEMEPYTSGWGGRALLAKGNWYVSGIGHYYFQNGDLYGLTPRDKPQKFAGPMKGNYLSGYGTVYGHSESQYVLANRPRLQVDPANQKHTGVFRDPVLTEDAIYYSLPINKEIERNFRTVGEGYEGIVAYNITKFTLEEREDNINTIDVKWMTTVFDELWRLPSNLKVHIKAGSRLYAGGAGVVAAVDIPQQEGELKVSWKVEIKGTPSRMLAAHGKLFVVTEEGRIYCFGGNEVQPKSYAMKHSRMTSPPDEWTKKASQILKLTGITEGYCLALGIGTGRLVEELALQSELHIIVIDPNAKRVDTAREKLDEMGLYGSRIHILAGDLQSIQLPQYMASLTVSENLKGFGFEQGQAFVEKLFDSMHPYGGMACLPTPQVEHAAFAERVKGINIPNAEVKREGDFTLLIRKGALPGSADWTHVGADAGNTLTSKDQLVKGPMGVLWFGGSVDSIFPDFDYTHSRHPVPLVLGGRIFIQVRNRLYAADIYTGQHLWTASLPPLERKRGGYNYAVAEDGIYVVFNKMCFRLDPSTGSKLWQINVPEGLAKEEPPVWREIRIWKEYLIGVTGNYLLCMDLRSGKILWKFRFQQNLYSFAVGDDKVFCADYSPPSREGFKKVDGKILALDTDSGKVIWQKTVNVSGKEFQPLLAYNDLNDVLLIVPLSENVSAYSGRDGALLWNMDIPNCYPSILHHDVLIAYHGKMYDPRTGFQLPMQLWKGVNRWSVEVGGTRGCGYAIASEHLIMLRDTHSHYFDLETGGRTYIRGVRSGCTPSLIPAGGLLNAPKYARGCSCNYGLFTSLALVYMPEPAMWNPASSSEAKEK